VSHRCTQLTRISQVNVLGVLHSIQAFFPTKPANAIYIGISSAVLTIPGAGCADSTAYQSSKIAMNKFLETFSYENPDDRVHIVHPGVVATDMMAKSKVEFPMDKGTVPCHFPTSISAERSLTALSSGASGKFHRLVVES